MGDLINNNATAIRKEVQMKVVVKNGMIGKGLSFQRLRRVTGYLSGDYKTRFNDGKIAEVNARVKHC